MALEEVGSGEVTPSALNAANSVFTLSEKGVYIAACGAGDLAGDDSFNFETRVDVVSGFVRRAHLFQPLGFGISEPLALGRPVPALGEVNLRIVQLTGTVDSLTIPWAVYRVQTEEIVAEQSGTASPTVGVDLELVDSSNSRYCFIGLDVSNLDNGDELEIKIESKLTSLSAYQILYQRRLVHRQSTIYWLSPPIDFPHGYRVTINQKAGTARTFLWSVISVAS